MTTDDKESPTEKGVPPATGLVSFEVSEPFESDGKLVRAITARHSDGFVCLRFEDVDPTAPAVESGDDDLMTF